MGKLSAETVTSDNVVQLDFWLRMLYSTAFIVSINLSSILLPSMQFPSKLG